MKKKYVAAICLVVWAVCLAISACDTVVPELPSDTSAIEEYIETTSTALYSGNP